MNELKYSVFKDVVKKDDGVDRWIVENIVRKVSIRVSWVLVRYFKISNPNLVTLIGFFIGISGLFFIGLGGKIFTSLGVFLIIIWFFSDHVDGEIARFTNNQSLRGRFFDNVVDQTILSLLIAFSTIWVFWNISEVYVLLIGFTSTVFFLLNRLLTGLRAENLLKSGFSEYKSPVNELEDQNKNKNIVHKVGIKISRIYIFLIGSPTMISAFSFSLIFDTFFYRKFQFFGFEINVTFLLISVYLLMVPFYITLLYGYYLDFHEKEN